MKKIRNFRLLDVWPIWVAWGLLIILSYPAGAWGAQEDPNLETWIFVLNKNVAPDEFRTDLCSASNSLRQRHNYTCGATFSLVLRGVAGRFTRQAVRDVKLRYKDSLDYVSRSQTFSVGDELVTPQEVEQQRRRMQQEHDEQQREWERRLGEEYEAGQAHAGEPAGHRHRGRMLPVELDPASWGLDRIDQEALPLDHAYRYDSYGTGVHVYVVDSGIRATHMEFRTMAAPPSTSNPGAVAGSGNRIGNGFSSTGGVSTEDCNSHGTHVAAIVGGLTMGVAKNVTLHPVQVLDCYANSDESKIIAGLEWVARNLQLPAVVHMSLEGYYSATVNAAVDELVNTYGAVAVAAAGNHNKDSCTISPASASTAITVAAIDSDGTKWYNSNWGTCVDLFAPGVNIMSAVPWSDSSSYTKTGTSMAAPFVSGVAALYLEGHPGASAADVAQRLYRSAIPGAVRNDRSGLDTFSKPPPGSPSWGPLDISSTPNRLLQSALQVPARLLPGVLTISADQLAAAATWPAAPGVPAPAVAPTVGVYGTTLNASQPAPTPMATTAVASAAGRYAVDVTLLLQPTSQVNVTASIPLAWNGQPVAALTPPLLTITNATSSSPQRLLLTPNPAAAQGTYYVTLNMRSADPRFDFAVHSFRVVDTRPQVGEWVFSPRVITSLPFTDSGNTLMFRHDYATSPGNPLDTSPDVVYSFTPRAPMAIAASTCGSAFDTVLLLGPAASAGASDAVNGVRQDDLLANDDDRVTCDPWAGNSRIDANVAAGVTYYIIVSGYNGAAGDFTLKVTCNAGCGAVAAT